MNFKQAFRQANDYFVEEMYDDALDHYNTAILLQNDSSDAYAKRANCNIKLRKYKEAVIDANTAIQIDGRNARGHLRRGIGLFYLGDYENALKAFEAGLSVADKDKENFQTWIKRTKATLPKPPPEKKPAPTPNNNNNNNNNNKPPEPVVPKPTPVAQPPPVVPLVPSAPKIRHEWYQNETFVTVTVFAKGLDPKDVDIKIQETTLEVHIKLKDDTTYDLQLNLYGKVDPAGSKHELLSTKVEVKLKKAESVAWPSLEVKTTPAASTSNTNKKNWDSIVKDEGNEEDKSEMGFLRGLWSGASEEEQRAMRKSMEQSNGTVLNMNWGQVESKNVKPKPPGQSHEPDSDEDDPWSTKSMERRHGHGRRRRKNPPGWDDEHGSDSDDE